MNIMTLIRSSKYFFQIRGSQTFPCQGPPKLHVFGRRPPYRKRSFQGRPETEIWVTEDSFEKYIFKDLNKCSLFFKNSRSRIFIESGQNIQRLADIFTISFKNSRSTSSQRGGRRHSVESVFLWSTAQGVTEATRSKFVDRLFLAHDRAIITMSLRFCLLLIISLNYALYAHMEIYFRPKTRNVIYIYIIRTSGETTLMIKWRFVFSSWAIMCSLCFATM